MQIASHFPVEPPPDRFPCRLHAASTRKAAWCSSTWTARAFQESQITYSKRSPLSEKVVNQMQALNKADFTQANIRLTLLETRKRAAMSGHSTGQSRLILLLAQGSRALAQCRRRGQDSGAGWGQQQCSPPPEPDPTAPPAPVRPPELLQALKGKQKRGEHFCIMDVERIMLRTERFSWCVFSTVFFQMWSKPLVCTQKKR